MSSLPGDSFETPLSSPMTPTISRAKAVLLDDLDMSCPSPNCDGWLMAYGDCTTQIPSFLKCSNDYEKEGVKMCTQKTIFSKYKGACSYCNKKIKVKEIITSDDKMLASAGASPRKWVHSKCFGRGPNIFAICQRCRKPIESELDAMDSICGGVIGKRHIKCPNKRKLWPEESSILSSQEDEASVYGD